MPEKIDLSSIEAVQAVAQEHERTVGQTEAELEATRK